MNIKDNIYLNKYNLKPYIILENYIYQFNWDIIEINEEIDLNIFENKELFIKLSDINTELLLNYLQIHFDKYKILENNTTFLKKWRLVYYYHSDCNIPAIITNVNSIVFNENNKEIDYIEIITLKWDKIRINKENITTSLYKLVNLEEIQIDLILEILFFYNLDDNNISIKPFLK